MGKGSNQHGPRLLITVEIGGAGTRRPGGAPAHLLQSPATLASPPSFCAPKHWIHRCRSPHGASRRIRTRRGNLYMSRGKERPIISTVHPTLQRGNKKKVIAWTNFAGTIGGQLRLAGESQAPDPRPLVINGPWPLPTPCRKATCHVPSPTHPQKVTRPLLLPCTKQSQTRGRARREILPPQSHPGAPNFFLPARPRQPPHHLPFLAIAASRTVEHSFRIPTRSSVSIQTSPSALP